MPSTREDPEVYPGICEKSHKCERGVRRAKLGEGGRDDVR
jgi:hypothetical protein